ncbi:MAG: carboxypeptidase-like regulatory domain-containing protein [Acidobacteriia bacterium]|nr:carboxypeptidase-like regulatory domain-containing protein [Terriglobia bacterium]
MIRKLGFLAVVLSLALPVWSAAGPGAISGYVRNASGVPQMGAAVEVLGSALHTLKAFTDDQGFYSIANVLPGTYTLKVSAPSFLPSLREKIGIRPGSKLMVNVTLTTLFEAMQLGPLRGPADDDDWKWTLRSVSNRPILRMLPDGTTAVAQGVEPGGDRDLKGSLVFMAGSASQGFGGASDMSAGFSVEHAFLSTGTLSLNGNVGYGDGGLVPAAVIRTSYTNHLSSGFEPSVALTLRRLNSPDNNNLHNGSMEALSLTASDRMVLGNVLELKFGSELQTIQFLQRVNTFKPFASADLHLTPDSVVEYQYASSVPAISMEKGFDSVPSDLVGAGPRMSITGFTPAVERAHHQEVSLSERIGKTNLQVAFYSDRITDPALTGLGDLTAESGEVLPDTYSGTFSYQGNDFSTRGMRVVLQRKLLSDLTATLDYAYGGVLDLARPDVELQDAREWMRPEGRQSAAAKFSGTVPCAKTRWIASYRWTSGQALTPVDLFNTSAGQADPYFNLFVRQPIPTSFLAGHMEVLVDLRNLLAQGYVPVIGRDGHTLYLVQSARSVRGGVAFSF